MYPEEMIGKHIFSVPFPFLNGKCITKVVKKAFPYDKQSTLWIVQCDNKRRNYQIYEDEMV